jgi:hypothetical protein
MEKVVHILIGHYTNIIFPSETIVPIGTKPYRNIGLEIIYIQFSFCCNKLKKKIPQSEQFQNQISKS